LTRYAARDGKEIEEAPSTRLVSEHLILVDRILQEEEEAALLVDEFALLEDEEDELLPPNELSLRVASKTGG
jgi:hypothetical protein